MILTWRKSSLMQGRDLAHGIQSLQSMPFNEKIGHNARKNSRDFALLW
jgi:hypothetical protein